MVFEVEQHERGAIDLVHLGQRLHDRAGIHGVDGGGSDGWQLALDGFNFVVREARGAAPGAEEFPMQRRKKPGLDLRAVAQLLALGGPEEERLLGEVIGLGLALRQAQSEAVERLVVVAHELLEVRLVHGG